MVKAKFLPKNVNLSIGELSFSATSDSNSSISSNSGGIGSDASVIAKSNFSELFPDRINVPIIRGSDTQERYFTFEGFFNRSAPNDMVQYEWNIGATERFNITFKNNANGDWDAYTEQSDISNTDVDFSKIPSAITNQPTLKEFIDADRAIYLGGSSSSNGSSSGGIGSLPAIIDNSNFYTTLPDAIICSEGADTYQYTLKLQRVSPEGFVYRNEDHGDGSTLDRHLQFKNDTDGSPKDVSFFTTMGVNSLKWFIENDRAIYSSGTSSSSTFSSLTDTPSELSAGKYAKVNDAGDGIEFVDEPFTTSGGIGNSNDIKNKSNFNGVQPDYLLFYYL